MIFVGESEIRRILTMPVCIDLMRKAMADFSAGRTRQILRSALDLDGGRLLVMPGALGADEIFGTKLISIFPENFAKGKHSHQGVIVLFEAEDGAPVCVMDAAPVTAIRTAAMSAAATDALARPEARVLALLGYGEQARSHAAAMAGVRDIEKIVVWGRDAAKAAQFAAALASETGVEAESVDVVMAATAEADIICTLTGAADPVLHSDAVRPGAHVNLVGSSHAGAAEADEALVARSRFIADWRQSVIEQGGEFRRARAAGLVDESHIAAEIGEVFSAAAEGRRSADEVTVFKSLGHIVQDLSAAAYILNAVREEAKT